MGLFSIPPAPPRTDLNLDMFLGSDRTESTLRRPRRTLPAEWAAQSGVWITWPHAGTDWAYMLDEVTECYVRLAFEIATRETLIIVHPRPDEVRLLLETRLPRRATDHIIYHACATNDTWARDHAFLTVLGTGGAELMDYRFNGWGGKFEARLDNALNRHLCDAGLLNGHYTDCLDFELEGGSIESDGAGTLLTTAQCLLNPNRNPQMDKAGIEERLCRELGAERILWLENGALEGDDTDSHVDTLARLCPEDTIAYVTCSDPSDSHYEGLRRMEEELKAFRTLEGNPYRLIPLPLPAPVYDTDGERLPATYANFLIMDSAVLLPTYAQPELDEAAKQALQQAFPRLEIVGVDCRALIRQHGSLHCATMQFPRGVIKSLDR